MKHTVAVEESALFRTTQAGIKALRSDLRVLAQEVGKVVIPKSAITVDQILDGGRGIPVFISPISWVRRKEGLIVRDRRIGELANSGVTPEGMLHLMLTGKLPSAEEEREIRELLAARSKVPAGIFQMLAATDSEVNPMANLSMALLGMSGESTFRKAYRAGGLPPEDHWHFTLEDGLRVIARTPGIVAAIYRIKYGAGVGSLTSMPAYSSECTFGQNLARMMGIGDEENTRRLGLFLDKFVVLHLTHGDANASAEVSEITDSTLANLFSCIAAGLCALEGPRHGGASGDCLKWLQKIHKKFGGIPDPAELRDFVWRCVSNDPENPGPRETIPGFSHAQLGIEDPRLVALIQLGAELCPEDPLYKTMLVAREVVTSVMMQEPRIRNPYGNVDLGSGAISHFLGITDTDMYPLLFGLARTLGFIARAVLARGVLGKILRFDEITVADAKALNGQS